VRDRAHARQGECPEGRREARRAQTGLTHRYPARVRSGSSTEMLGVSISRPQFSKKADYPTPAGEGSPSPRPAQVGFAHA
jgi:hypothetical protein